MLNKKYYIAVTAILLFALFMFIPSKSEGNTFVLEKIDFKETISASGRVDSKNRIDMNFQKTGTIQKIFATEGETYQKGDILISLEKSEEENDLDSKNLQLRTAYNNLKEVENKYKIEQMNYQVLLKSLESTKLLLERNMKLYEAGAVSKEEIEDLSLKLIETEARVAQGKLVNDSLAPGGSTREKALIDIANAKIQVEKSEIERNKKNIIAPFDGKVLNIVKENYSNVQSGEIGIIFAEESPFIVTDIDERDYQKVKVGLKGFIQLLNSEEIYEATIRDVSPVIDRTKGTVRVRLDINEKVSLKTDIGVNVEIIVNEYKDQLIVPKEFVFTEPTRIILDENGRGKIIELTSFDIAGDYYVLKDSELLQYVGMKIIAADIKDGEKIK